MHTEPQNSSGAKITTSSQRLLATAMIGAALISYQVHKTAGARTRLESLASQTELTESDAALVAEHLAKPVRIAKPLEA